MYVARFETRFVVLAYMNNKQVIFLIGLLAVAAFSFCSLAIELARAYNLLQTKQVEARTCDE